MNKFIYILILLSANLTGQLNRTASHYYAQDTTAITLPVSPYPQYSTEYAEVLIYADNQGITKPADSVLVEQDKLMKELVRSGTYAALKSNPKQMFHCWLGDSSTTIEFMGINWLNPNKYYATQMGSVNVHPYYGINSSSNNDYLDPNFEIFTHDTTWLYKNMSMGAYNVGGNLSANGGKQMGAASQSGSTKDQYLNVWRGIFGTSPNLWVALSGTLSQSRTTATTFSTKPPSFSSIHRTHLDSAEISDKLTNSFIINRAATFDVPGFISPSYTFWQEVIANKGYATLTSDFDFIVQSASEAEDLSGRSSRYMKLGILAQIVTDYTNVSDTINPISITAGDYSRDTIIFSYIGGTVWDKLHDFNYALTRYKDYFRKHNEKTIETEISSNSYEPIAYNTDSMLPLLPRRVNKYGLDFQLPRANVDSFAIWKVTTTNMTGAGSFLAAIDSCEGNGKYDFIIFEVGGLIDTNIYIERKILEDKGLMIFGQTAPSPGIRIQSLGIRTDKQTKMVTFQHLRIGAGHDTLPGVARDSITSAIPPSWTQYSERDALALGGVYQIVDHCTLSFGTDETISGAPSNATISNNLISKPLGYKYHNKGAHPKGAAFYKQDTGQGQNFALYRNVFYGTDDRNPEMTNEMTGVVRENYILNQAGRGSSFIASLAFDDSLTGFGILDISYNYYDRVDGPVIRFASLGNATREAEVSASSEGFGSKMIYAKNNTIDGKVYADAWDESCVVISQSPITFNYEPSGCLPGDSITRDSIMRDIPLYTLPNWDTLPSNIASNYLIKYAGARPMERDTLEQEIFIEMANKTRTIWPYDISNYSTLIQNIPTNTQGITLPANPFEVDSTGYMWIERYADSLHWQVTYPPTITYPGIPASTGAFLYENNNPFIIGNNTIYRKTV